MAREYPRFLFSNPQNTKSKGPFIIHTLTPRIICKIYERHAPGYNRDKHLSALHFGRFAIEFIELWDDSQSKQIAETMTEMNDWLLSQIEDGEINMPG